MKPLKVVLPTIVIKDCIFISFSLSIAYLMDDTGICSFDFYVYACLIIYRFIAFAAHKFSQAIDLYTQAIELNHDNAVYWANRAFAHTKLEEYGSAIQDATSAIEIDPKYSKASTVGFCFVFEGKGVFFFGI